MPARARVSGHSASNSNVTWRGFGIFVSSPASGGCLEGDVVVGNSLPVIVLRRGLTGSTAGLTTTLGGTRHGHWLLLGELVAAGAATATAVARPTQKNDIVGDYFGCIDLLAVFVV